MDIPIYNPYFREGFNRGFKTNQKDEFENGDRDGMDKGFFLAKKIVKKTQAKELAKIMIYKNEPEEKIELYTELTKNEIDTLREEIKDLLNFRTKTRRLPDENKY